MYLHKCINLPYKICILECLRRHRSTSTCTHLSDYYFPCQTQPALGKSRSPFCQTQPALGKSRSPLCQILDPPLYRHCIATVSPLYRHCIATVSPLYRHCIATVSPLYHHCIATVSPLYRHCIATVSPLYRHCIATVSMWPIKIICIHFGPIIFSI